MGEAVEVNNVLAMTCKNGLHSTLQKITERSVQQAAASSTTWNSITLGKTEKKKIVDAFSLEQAERPAQHPLSLSTPVLEI
jgi:hypothetical protein